MHIVEYAPGKFVDANKIDTIWQTKEGGIFFSIQFDIEGRYNVEIEYVNRFIDSINFVNQSDVYLTATKISNGKADENNSIEQVTQKILAQHTLSNEDLDICRQWFEAVQDLNPASLEPEDYQLAYRIYTKLRSRVPNSITENL